MCPVNQSALLGTIQMVGVDTFVIFKAGIFLKSPYLEKKWYCTQHTIGYVCQYL